MKLLKKISTIIILSVFLFATTGVTVRQHICHSSGTNQVIWFPELTAAGESVCCPDEVTPCCRYTPGSADEQISCSACCEDVNSFVRLQFVTEQINWTTVGSMAGKTIPVADRNFVVEQPDIPITHHLISSHSPPLSGRDLIRYLHQMKIPFPDHLG